MARKKLLTLAKELDFTTEHEYFDYIISSEINGQRSQVRKLISEMKRSDQITFVYYAECTTEKKYYTVFLDIIL